jgi:hypothetical protein
MDPKPMEVTIAVIPILMLLGLVVLAAVEMWRRGRTAEMAHRERMAMIDKGLVPPPEPSVSASVFGPEGRTGPHVRQTPTGRQREARFRTLGVQLIGLGFALMLIIGLTAGAPEAGVGTGGAVAVLGVALVVNGYLSRRDMPPVQAQTPATHENDLPEGR